MCKVLRRSLAVVALFMSAHLAAGNRLPVDLVSLPSAPEGLYECTDLADVNINELDTSVDRCFELDAVTGFLVPGSIHPLLEAKLLAGGGLPMATDACAVRLNVCVTDEVTDPGPSNPCTGNSILRTFTISELGCVDDSDVDPVPASYTIAFAPIRSDDLEVSNVKEVIRLECSDLESYMLAVGEVPNPSSADYPTLTLANGEVLTLEPGATDVCNLGLTYDDSPVIFSCPQSYTVVRTWTLRDNCNAADVRTYAQILLVGDFTAPTFAPPFQDNDMDGVADTEPISFSTNIPGACAARVRLDLPSIQLTDDCSTEPGLRADIYSAINLTAPIQTGIELRLNDAEAETTQALGPGSYVIRYFYFDECGNESFTDVEMVVRDRNVPTVVCQPGMAVQLNFTPPGNEGSAVVTTAMIDGGSTDDCSPILFVGIALVTVDENNEQTPTGGSDYTTSISLTCAEQGSNTIGLRVTDEAGNVSFCTSQVEVETAAIPVCQPPAPVSLSCESLAARGLASDLTVETSENLDAVFGAAIGTGACVSTVSQVINGQSDGCGDATFTRSFTVNTPDGAQSGNACEQQIVISSTSNYSIGFPGDRPGTCDAMPDAAEVEILEGSCDMIVTTVTSARQATGQPHCYDLAVTYRTINLCEFDPASAVIQVNRDFDGDGIVDEPTFLHLFPNQDRGPKDDEVRLDDDPDRNDGGFMPLLIANYGTSGNRGGFSYTQRIRVEDFVGPEVRATAPANCFPLTGQDCLGTARIILDLDDDCTAREALTLTGELDLNYNGIIFQRTRFLLDQEIIPDGNGRAVVKVPRLPRGTHALRMSSRDDCGNIGTRIVPICVDEVVNAAPICMEQVAVTLQPTGNGTATAAVFAKDFIPEDTDFCGEDITYAIYSEQEAGAAGFEASPDRDGLLVNCGSSEIEQLRVYAFNASGESSYCTVNSLVLREGNTCVADGTGVVWGSITSEGGVPMPRVLVEASGEAGSSVVTSGADGNYLFENLAASTDHTITPELEDYRLHRQGVTSADILIISRHILGILQINNPYKLLAADTSPDEVITVRDIIIIRRLILGIDEAYPNNKAYRFVKADFVFPIPNDPWATMFPEAININNLGEEYQDANFIGIMIGDVNGTGIRRLRASDWPRTQRSALVMENTSLPFGEIRELNFYAAELPDMQAAQATIEFSGAIQLLEVLPGIVPVDRMNLSRLKEGLFSFAHEEVAGFSGEVLFSARVVSTRSVNVREECFVSDRLTYSEAYVAGEAVRPRIQFIDGLSSKTRIFGLSLSPNPMVNHAQITFEVENAGVVTLQVQDAGGRMVLSKKHLTFPGSNTLLLSEAELNGSGIYCLTLTTEEGRVMRKLVVK